MPSIALRFGSAVCLAGLVAGCTAGAQAPLPAEVPPDSYAGTQYVDSRGCVFIRAGRSGPAGWVPRLTRSREHLCGFSPTFPAGVPAADTLPDDVPIIAGVLAPPPDGAPPEEQAKASAPEAMAPGPAAGPVEVAQASRPAAAGTSSPAAPTVTAAKHVRAGPPATARQAVALDPAVPASNPAVGTVTPPPSGYEPVWSDGRINFARGLQPRSAVPHPPR